MRSAGTIPGGRSSRLTPISEAAWTSRFGAGGRRAISRPGTSSRSSPCQPRPRIEPGSAAHPSSTSSATGATRTASSPDAQWGGRAASGIRSADARNRWRTLSNTGPDSSLASAMTTPAARRRSSSRAEAASASAPTRALTRNPRRPSVSAPYVTAPPSRQPRGSSGVTSRDAAPTTSTLGGVVTRGSIEDRPAAPGRRRSRGRERAHSDVRERPPGGDNARAGRSGGPRRGRVYSAGPSPPLPEPFLVFLQGHGVH